MRNIQLGLHLLLIFFFLETTAQSQAKFPDSPAGNRARAYLEAFNTGKEELMRVFFQENIAEDSLKKRSMEERIHFYREVHQETGSLEIEKIIERSPDSIVVSAQGAKGVRLTITFEFQADPPQKITGMQVDAGDDPESEPAQSKKKSEAEAVSSLEKLSSDLAGRDEFSGVVLLARDGVPLFYKAYGYASREFQVPNRTDTKFNLGSINKLFTQIAILQLNEKGKISLDDLLSKHLPDYPNKPAAAKITIRHLLEMSSGIGDFFGEKFDSTPKNRFRNLSDFLFTFADEPLLFEPGTQNRYSNGGYIILGLIIEKVSGQSYYDYVRNNIFKVAGMENTDSYEADSVVKNLAVGYTKEVCTSGSCDRRTNIYSRPARGSSAGGGYSTAEDLRKLTAALKAGKILTPENAARILSRGYAGGAEGINALFEPDYRGYTIIVLVNEDPPLAERVGRKIRGWLPV
jgi:CubicO group peptidase (beta-lactamase class C family)